MIDKFITFVENNEGLTLSIGAIMLVIGFLFEIPLLLIAGALLSLIYLTLTK